MLYLLRRIGEAIVIDTPAGRCRIIIGKIDRGEVNLIFDAAREIQILRSELIPEVEICESNLPPAT